MGDTNTRLPAIDPLLAQSARDGSRVRLVLKPTEADGHRARIVEGIVVAIVTGRDGRARVRMGIPTGSGDPVEVRVLLGSIERIERVEGSSDAVGTSEPKPSTGEHRRATLSFGSDPQLRPSPKTTGVEVARGDSWNDLPGVNAPTRRGT